MNFSMTENQKIVMEVASEFAAKELAPKAEHIDKTGEFDAELIRKMTESNLMGLLIPEPLGGAGMDKLCYVQAVEELARVCPSAGLVLMAQSMFSFAVLAFGSDMLKREVLPALSQGAVGAMAVTEPNASSNMMAIQTKGTPFNGGFKITGNKIFCTNSGIADYFTVLFKSSDQPGPASLTLGVVRKGTPGFILGKREKTMGLRGDDLREMIFDGCYIPAENILGQIGNGMEITHIAGAIGFLGVSSTAVGAAQACFDLSKKYAKERISFGPIANQQIIQLYISEMANLVEISRLVIQKAAVGLDNGEKNPANIWKARLFCIESARRVADLTSRIYSSYGFTEEYPVSRFVRDIAGLPYIYSTQEILGTYVGKTELGLPLMG